MLALGLRPRRSGSTLTVAFFSAFWLLAALLAGSACSGGPAGPGQPCAQASDCGCWECTCVGVTGSPGAAQLCVEGKCPTGTQACGISCGTRGAKVATATEVDTCPARP